MKMECVVQRWCWQGILRRLGKGSGALSKKSCALPRYTAHKPARPKSKKQENG
nr:MAG TPA: hypothetical protein [Caudoviricetes sp.]